MAKKTDPKKKGDPKKKKPNIYVLGYEPDRDITQYEIDGNLEFYRDEVKYAGTSPELEREIKKYEEYSKQFKETGRVRDLTFRNEYNRKGGGKDVLDRDYNSIYISVGQGGFEKAMSKVPQGEKMMYMDHSGSKMFGQSSKDFTDALISKNPSTCIGGTCYGEELFGKQLREGLPNSEIILDNDSWEGFDASQQGVKAIVKDNYAMGGPIRYHDGGIVGSNGINYMNVSRTPAINKELAWQKANINPPRLKHGGMGREEFLDFVERGLDPHTGLPAKEGGVGYNDNSEEDNDDWEQFKKYPQGINGAVDPKYDNTSMQEVLGNEMGGLLNMMQNPGPTAMEMPRNVNQSQGFFNMGGAIRAIPQVRVPQPPQYALGGMLGGMSMPQNIQEKRSNMMNSQAAGYNAQQFADPNQPRQLNQQPQLIQQSQQSQQHPQTPQGPMDFLQNPMNLMKSFMPGGFEGGGIVDSTGQSKNPKTAAAAYKQPQAFGTSLNTNNIKVDLSQKMPMMNTAPTNSIPLESSIAFATTDTNAGKYQIQQMQQAEQQAQQAQQQGQQQGPQQFAEGGEIPAEQLPVPVQAEKGEMIMFSDGMITKTNADKKHKNMSFEEVTDILPEGAYVASANKRMKISKKEAGTALVGTTPITYEEGKTGRKPKEVLFSEMMRKNNMYPSEIARAIKNKYPITSRESDPFSTVAIDENKQSRQPYIEGIRYFTEDKKGGKGIPQEFKYGGMIPKQLDGGGGGFLSKINPLGAITEGVKVLTGITRGIAGSASAKKRFERNQKTIDDSFAKQQELLSQGTDETTALQVAASLAQNPAVDAPSLRKSIGVTEAMLDKVDPSQRAAFVEQARRQSGTALGQLYQLDPRQASYAAGNTLAQGIQSTGDVMAKFGLNDVQLTNQKLGSLDKVYQQDAINKATARNQQTTNTNQVSENLFGGLGDIRGNFYNQQMALESSLSQSTLQNEANRANEVNAAWSDGAGMIATVNPQNMINQGGMGGNSGGNSGGYFGATQQNMPAAFQNSALTNTSFNPNASYNFNGRYNPMSGSQYLDPNYKFGG